MAKRKRAAAKTNKAAKGKNIKQEEPTEVTENAGAPDANVDQDQYEGLTEYEIERLKIIERNRARLMALGLPGLMNKLQQTVHPAKARPAAKKPKAKRAKPTAVKSEEGEQEPTGPRRSTRQQVLASKPKPETTEEKFMRELGEFIVDGECPRCGRIFEKGHKNHLQSCTGATRNFKTSYSREKEILELPEEDRKDPKKRMMARMKALDLSGLVNFDDDEAKFIVIGSRGDPYTITLNDTKHKCACLDFRFRGSQRPCKHLSLVLQQLGILEEPSTWREAVEGQLKELIANSKVNQGVHPEEQPPADKEALEALKYL